VGGLGSRPWLEGKGWVAMASPKEQLFRELTLKWMGGMPRHQAMAGRQVLAGQLALAGTQRTAGPGGPL